MRWSVLCASQKSMVVASCLLLMTEMVNNDGR